MAFLLQRQSKVQATDLIDVDDGSAKWNQVLKQVSFLPQNPA